MKFQLLIETIKFQFRQYKLSISKSIPFTRNRFCFNEKKKFNNWLIGISKIKNYNFNH